MGNGNKRGSNRTAFSTVTSPPEIVLHSFDWVHFVFPFSSLSVACWRPTLSLFSHHYMNNFTHSNDKYIRRHRERESVINIVLRHYHRRFASAAPAAKINKIFEWKIRKKTCISLLLLLDLCLPFGIARDPRTKRRKVMWKLKMWCPHIANTKKTAKYAATALPLAARHRRRKRPHREQHRKKA